MLVSIDPGVKHCGVALWDDDQLASAWLAKGPNWYQTAINVGRGINQHVPNIDRHDIVIEKPQIYHQSRLKGDPNDLIDLAVFVGAVCMAVATGDVRMYLPREWKGSTPKDVKIERIKKSLSVEEHSRIDLPAPSLQHNVFDAVGIGLHHLRSKRRGTKK